MTFEPKLIKFSKDGIRAFTQKVAGQFDDLLSMYDPDPAFLPFTESNTESGSTSKPTPSIFFNYQSDDNTLTIGLEVGEEEVLFLNWLITPFGARHLCTAYTDTNSLSTDTALIAQWVIEYQEGYLQNAVEIEFNKLYTSICGLETAEI